MSGGMSGKITWQGFKFMLEKAWEQAKNGLFGVSMEVLTVIRLVAKSFIG